MFLFAFRFVLCLVVCVWLGSVFFALNCCSVVTALPSLLLAFSVPVGCFYPYVSFVTSSIFTTTTVSIVLFRFSIFRFVVVSTFLWILLSSDILSHIYLHVRLLIDTCSCICISQSSFSFLFFVLFISMSFQLHVQLQLDFSSCFVFHRHSQLSFCARELRTSAIFDLQPRRNRRRRASHEKRELGKRAEEHTHQPSRTTGRMIGGRILESRHDIIARRKGGNECK